MRAFVGLGSNLGDRWGWLRLASRELRAAPGVAIVRASRVYDTEPLGPAQPRYLNAVLELETSRTPESLLELLGAVEVRALRRRELHWGPRTLDLDLLAQGNLVRRGPRLVLPHLGIASRRFVLVPLAELCEAVASPEPGAPPRRLADLLLAAPPGDVRPVGSYPL